jgi:cytochrome c5
MDWTPSAELINGILQAWQASQLALLSLWHALGLGNAVHGQSAWPWDTRLSAQALLSDANLARSVVLGSVALIAIAAALLLAVWLQRGRWWLVAAAVVVAMLTPWPDAALVFVPAVPTSLHRSTTGFGAHSIVRGRAVYAQHCVRCHGDDAAGQGPDAAGLPMWPPNLTGTLLWKRLEGELFWRVQHGMQDRVGKVTMPAFAGQVSDADTWAVLDYLQAQAAGQALKITGAWNAPIRLPTVAVRCRDGSNTTTHALLGQRLQVVFPRSPSERTELDPRMVSVVVAARASDGTECSVTDADMPHALATILGVSTDALAGNRLLVDRMGWLRARSAPNQPGWSQDDLVCKSPGDTAPKVSAVALAGASKPATGDGLDALIRTMDAQPVQLVRGGYPH